MKLDAMVEKMKFDIGDSTLTKEDEWPRCVEKAVSDLTRVLPQQKVADFTTLFSVSTTFTTHAAVKATPVSIGYTYIKPSTVVVSLLTTTYVEGTDYSIDCITGYITPITAGAMVVNTTYTVTFDLIRTGIDISSIADGLLRIENVEYQAAQTPQSFNSYSRWGNFLTIGSADTKSQTTLAETKHIFVYYTAEQTPPTDSDDGSYPVFLDEVVMIGAEGYALQMLADKLNEKIDQLVKDADDLLGTGDDLIDTLNNGGSSVAPAYMNYAGMKAQIAAFCVQEAGRLRQEASDKYGQFWAVLRDKMQLAKSTSSVPVKQGNY
jgi:hypothetical protein